MPSRRLEYRAAAQAAQSDQKMPKLNLESSEIIGVKYNGEISKNNNISRKIIKPDKEELQLHKEFLKSIFKKNF